MLKFGTLVLTKKIYRWFCPQSTTKMKIIFDLKTFWIFYLFIKEYDINFRGALSAAITVESCELFGEYTCKDTCGLCNLCNLAPGGSDRPECTTLCNLGINKCYSVCEAGKAKCSAFSPSTTTSIQTKAVVPRTS